MLRICALSVHFHTGSASFTLPEKYVFAVQTTALGSFSTASWSIFTGIVKRCSAKQNGCSGSQGTRDQWTKIVTNCPHPHDVALICDRDHSHASWTTAQHEKYFRTGSKQRRMHEAVVFLTGPCHPRLFLEWEGTCQDHDRGP